MSHAPAAQRELERLRQIRRQGRRCFIVRRGVVGWGLTMAALWCVASPFWQPDRSVLLTIGVGLVVFPVSGAVFGALMWRWLQRRWERLTGSDTVP